VNNLWGRFQAFERFISGLRFSFSLVKCSIIHAAYQLIAEYKNEVIYRFISLN